MNDKTILQRLDGLVDWTGVPALASGHPRRRPMRWPAAITLALAAGGYAINLLGGLKGGSFAIGIGMQALAMCASGFIAGFGPLKPFGSMERVDEWDRAIRTRSYMAAFTTFVVVTGAAAFLLLAALAFDWPRDAIMRGAMATIFLLEIIVMALPTAYASWTVRWQGDD
ncbi:hypothetical protein [Sphingomonas beigongshangi]|jgi:hypothetical protein|uniref:hypothetical protein n=1 Tax=Sphingomonas beigongshangi TaxID=2782540 RepID=UPI001AED7D2B|nr:hypothetical protein [Sphingomonas beigongshangi]